MSQIGEYERSFTAEPVEWPSPQPEQVQPETEKVGREVPEPSETVPNHE